MLIGHILTGTRLGVAVINLLGRACALGAAVTWRWVVARSPSLALSALA